jgi:hypothetical protein
MKSRIKAIIASAVLIGMACSAGSAVTVSAKSSGIGANAVAVNPGTSGNTGANFYNTGFNNSQSGYNFPNTYYNTEGTGNTGNTGNMGNTGNTGYNTYQNTNQRTNQSINQSTSYGGASVGFENFNDKRFEVSSGTYIIQDGDSLWLVMGNLKAKLSMLVYQEPDKDENAQNRSRSGNDQNRRQNQGSSHTNTGGTGEDKNNLAIPFIFFGK